jgi:hypothetical protein
MSPPRPSKKTPMRAALPVPFFGKERHEKMCEKRAFEAGKNLKEKDVLDAAENARHRFCAARIDV